MAVAHIDFSREQPYAARLHNSLDKFEEGWYEITEHLGGMTLMIDGDGSSESHFTYLATKYGAPGVAVAKAGYEEIASAMGKLATDGSVSSVNAALKQLFNKYR